MIEAIGESLPMSVGLALSPLPVAAVIMILMTTRASVNAPVFLAGWVVGILTVSLVVLLTPGIKTEEGEPSALYGAIQIALGLGLLVLAVRRWHQRPVRGEPVETPKLLTHLDNIGAIHSAAIGFFLSGINLKNLLLTAAGAAAIDATASTLKSQVLALVVFTAIGSVTVTVPVACYFLARPTADAAFGSWKEWLIRNNVTVVIVLLIVFGTVLISQGLSVVG